MKKSLLVVLVAPLIGCSLLIGLEDVPPDHVDDGSAEAAGEAATDGPSDAGSDVIVDAALDPLDCGDAHAVCTSGICAPGGCVRRIFVLSSVQNGDFGTISGVNFGCSDHNGTDLGDATFVPVISTSNMTAVERVGPSDAPFVLVDKTTVVASSSANLFGGAHESPINLTEDGGTISGTPYVWTGSTTTGGTYPLATCGDWTDASGLATGSVGICTDTTTNWLQNQTPTCNVVAHLYCVEK